MTDGSAARPAPEAAVGAALRGARQSAGLSLAALAAATGGRLSGAGLSRIEQGARLPNLRTLETLSEVLPIRVTVFGGQTRVEPVGDDESSSR